MKKINTEKLADYAVIFIALLALFVSFWQVRMAQNHNKLTVKPYLDAHVIQEDTILVVSFSNKGLGPAILKEMTFEVNNQKYPSIFQLLKAQGEEKNILSTFNYSKNSVFSSGEDMPLAKLRVGKNRGIQIKILYESIYEEKGILEFSF